VADSLRASGRRAVSARPRIALWTAANICRPLTTGGPYSLLLWRHGRTPPRPAFLSYWRNFAKKEEMKIVKFENEMILEVLGGQGEVKHRHIGVFEFENEMIFGGF
jgi:hypothetical protein